jgi:Asp-tRNA(Asn)/Glu-tRNA(Gln) amidotransferase A subunit family amidase
MASTHELDALQVAAQYAAGALSPVDVARDCLARIDAWEPKLNAMYRIDRDGAMAAAKARKPLAAAAAVAAGRRAGHDQENIYTRAIRRRSAPRQTMTRRPSRQMPRQLPDYARPAA